ncbi:MAG: phenylalanine--tRNA ligase subunit beta [Actinobacteria bacterium]|nr:MAG: phenylalanine--tRNA ligase subunit beta [Actinomycetota bacterium]
MRVPLSWLKDFAPIEADTPTLVDTLNELGLVVDGVAEIEAVDESVVVARVLATRAHPGADKVQLVDVDAGGEQLQIVCGAFNFGTGDLVSLARLGTVLPNGAQIDRRQVRGEWSEGMLCSAAELGLSDDHNGILVLAVDTEPGVPLRKALAMEPDVVFELDVTPNRPDAMSVAGVARDLAATLGIPFSLPDMSPVPSDESPASVAVKSKDLCPRFTAIVLDVVSVGPSPAWLARRLTLAGMRPINNVVDVSNYVMLELGQPNHPYDLTRLPGNGLLVRRGKKSETVTTLDEVERAVGPDDCLICDAEGTPVGIGGVMGGASSEIADGTTSVLLETAYFDPMAIARTARRLGLRTEASARFERGVDYNGLDRAVARSLALLAEVAGARPVGGLVDVRGRLPKSARPVVRTRRVNEILGTALTGDDVRRYLEPIGFECAPARGGWRVTVPSWRPDSELEIDVIEEVARHHGYSNIPRTVPLSPEVGRLTPYQHDRRRVREVLAGAALSEAWTTAFIGPSDLEKAGLPSDAVQVTNPLDQAEPLLRPSLLPGMLRAVATNARHQNLDVRLFEVGRVFAPPSGGDVLPTERELVAVALAGADATEATHVWNVLCGALALEQVTVDAGERPGLHPTRAARLLAANEEIGELGEVDPAVLAAYEIDGRVGWFAVDLQRLLAAPRRPAVFHPISRFPASDIDLAFVVDDSTPAAQVEQRLREVGGDLLVDVRLFDVFRGSQLGEGRRSLAYRLRFNALDHTLTDEEVGEIRQRCIDAVQSSLPATLRG